MSDYAKAKMQRELYRRNVYRRMTRALYCPQDARAVQHTAVERARRMGVRPDVLAAYERYKQRKSPVAAATADEG